MHNLKAGDYVVREKDFEFARIGNEDLILAKVVSVPRSDFDDVCLKSLIHKNEEYKNVGYETSCPEDYKVIQFE